MSADRSILREELTVLLSAALGQEKSDEVIVSAARDLGFPPATSYSAEEVRAIFARISEIGGLVGVVARFAISRGDVEKLTAGARPSERSPVPPARPTVVDLVPLLAPAIGDEKAREAIEAGCTRLALDSNALSPDDAFRVLDLLATAEGIVGVVARFAKARYLLSSGS